jgi:hypothetical protein
MTSREGHVKITARFKAVGHQSSVGIKLESWYQAGIVVSSWNRGTRKRATVVK